jgi:hypothetical protein
VPPFVEPLSERQQATVAASVKKLLLRFGVG